MVIDQSMVEMLFPNTLFPASNQDPLFDHNMAYSTGRQHPLGYFIDDTMGLGDGVRLSGRGGMMDVDWAGLEDRFSNDPAVVPAVQTGEIPEIETVVIDRDWYDSYTPAFNT